MRHAFRFLAAFVLAALSAPSLAQADPEPPSPGAEAPLRPWFVSTSVYTKHFHYDPAHNDHQDMFALEWRHDERYGLGFALFDNSFDQPTQYVFASARFTPFDREPELYIRLSGGVVHGYKGKYRNKVPLNSSGFAPVILPMVGYCRSFVCGEIVFFGTNGATALIGARF